MTERIAKYAFVYMAQPLTSSIPPFCLCCYGTDNSFTAEDVLKRWKYIQLECEKRGIKVISYGADGDSREVRAMRISAFHLTDPLGTYSPSFSLPEINIPKEWRCSWYAIQKPVSVAYIQDPVQLAVKLKARLLKPSICLPLGYLVASSGHLHLLRDSYSKDVHGIQLRDVSHKDRQNFEAVLRITSDSSLEVLKKSPEALGTYTYLFVLRCIVDSYITKDIEPLVRIEKAWTAIFFLRYWRKWIEDNPSYTINKNFVTYNAYLCCELNGHSLISFVITLRDHGDSKSEFIPWVLGSQSCEKMFRSARSMSTVFSTMINFGMLGLLCRLHRLNIQLQLECNRLTQQYAIHIV